MADTSELDDKQEKYTALITQTIRHASDMQRCRSKLCAIALGTGTARRRVDSITGFLLQLHADQLDESIPAKLPAESIATLLQSSSGGLTSPLEFSNHLDLLTKAFQAFGICGSFLEEIRKHIRVAQETGDYDAALSAIKLELI